MTSASEYRAQQARERQIREADARRAELTRAFGPAVRCSAEATVAALAKLGRQDIDPRETMAYRYRDQAAANAWQKSTYEHNHVASLGTIQGEDCVIGVYDLRTA